jgi:hypothetical protein
MDRPTIVTAGYRYDFFDPAKTKADNEVTGSSAFVSMFLLSGVRVTGEYARRDTVRGTGPHQLGDSFVARVEYYR